MRTEAERHYKILERKRLLIKSRRQQFEQRLARNSYEYRQVEQRQKINALHLREVRDAEVLQSRHKGGTLERGALQVRQERVLSLVREKQSLRSEGENLKNLANCSRDQVSLHKGQEQTISSLAAKEKTKLLRASALLQHKKLLDVVGGRHVFQNKKIGLQEQLEKASSDQKMTVRDEAFLMTSLVDISKSMIAHSATPFRTEVTPRVPGTGPVFKGGLSTQLVNPPGQPQSLEGRFTLPLSQESIGLVAIYLGPGQVEIRLSAATRRGHNLLRSKESRLKTMFGHSSRVRVLISEAPSDGSSHQPREPGAVR